MKRILLVLALAGCGDGGLVDVSLENSSAGGASQQEQAGAEGEELEECLRFVEIEEVLLCELPNGDFRPVENELEN